MGYTMTYQQYIAYHKGGDAGVEERILMGRMGTAT